MRFQPLIRLPPATCGGCGMEIFTNVIEIEQETPVHSELSVCLLCDPGGSIPQAVNRASADLVDLVRIVQPFLIIKEFLLPPFRI